MTLQGSIVPNTTTLSISGESRQMTIGDPPMANRAASCPGGQQSLDHPTDLRQGQPRSFFYSGESQAQETRKPSCSWSRGGANRGSLDLRSGRDRARPFAVDSFVPPATCSPIISGSGFDACEVEFDMGCLGHVSLQSWRLSSVAPLDSLSAECAVFDDVSGRSWIMPSELHPSIEHPLRHLRCDNVAHYDYPYE
jgi:hypothetical protein